MKELGEVVCGSVVILFIIPVVIWGVEKWCEFLFEKHGKDN